MMRHAGMQPKSDICDPACISTAFWVISFFIVTHLAHENY